MADTQYIHNHHLISSDRVEGTNVYNTQGDKLGSVDRLMIDKQKGRIAYAIMSFGGFLGLGEEYHPLPWDTLTYDNDKEGYVVNLSKDQLNDAPRLKREDTERLHDDAYARNVYGYYGIRPYW